MNKWGVFYHHSWSGSCENIPLPDLNYVRTDSHIKNESVIDIFNTKDDADRRRDELNSRLHSNQTGEYYSAPTTQNTNYVQRRFRILGSKIDSWK